MRLLLATALTGSIAAIATQGAAAVGVTETTPPSFSDVPPVVVVKVNGVRNATAEYQEPLAYDASGSSLAVTCSPPSGSTFDLGDTDVTCSATDSEGTAASVSFVVRVLDTVPPPAATDVVVRGDKNRVSLTWRLPASTDIAGTEIVRYPGAAGHLPQPRHDLRRYRRSGGRSLSLPGRELRLGRQSLESR